MIGVRRYEIDLIIITNNNVAPAKQAVNQPSANTMLGVREGDTLQLRRGIEHTYSNDISRFFVCPIQIISLPSMSVLRSWKYM